MVALTKQSLKQNYKSVLKQQLIVIGELKIPVYSTVKILLVGSITTLIMKPDKLRLYCIIPAVGVGVG